MNAAHQGSKKFRPNSIEKGTRVSLLRATQGVREDCSMPSSSGPVFCGHPGFFCLFLSNRAKIYQQRLQNCMRSSLERLNDPGTRSYRRINYLQDTIHGHLAWSTCTCTYRTCMICTCTDRRTFKVIRYR